MNVSTSGNMSKSDVHISVVTVVSNDLSGLRKSRLSLENQSFRNWTHVVVDSGIDGKTLNFLLTLPKASTKWISEPDLGIYNAMNKAVSMVEQESYVFFLNAGDIFASEDALATAAKVLKVSNLPNWGCTTHEEIASDGEGWICKLVSKPSIMNQLYATGYRSHQGVIMKKSLISSLGCFDETYKVAADWDLIVKAIMAETPITWNVPLARFETGGFSTQRILLAHEELFQLRKKYLLKKVSDHVYDYIWRSLFLYPIGYRTLLGRFLFPTFRKPKQNQVSLFWSLYRRFVIKEHNSLVRKVPSRLRRFMLKTLSSIYFPLMRPKVFYLLRRFLIKRLNLNNIEAA
jgi:glycosyltransferase involved in cell wall biosynthesis